MLRGIWPHSPIISGCRVVAGIKGALRTQEGIAAPVPRIADDLKDVHRLTEIVRYSPNWQGSDGDWRRDFVWVQEYEENSGRSAGASTLNRKRV